MKVKELIEILNTCNPDSVIEIRQSCDAASKAKSVDVIGTQASSNQRVIITDDK